MVLGPSSLIFCVVVDWLINMLLFLLWLLFLVVLVSDLELLNMNLALTLFENSSKSFCNWWQFIWSGVGIKEGPLAKTLIKLVKTSNEFPFKITGLCSFEWKDFMGDCPSFFVFLMFNWSFLNLCKRLFSKMVLNVVDLHHNRFLT